MTDQPHAKTREVDERETVRQIAAALEGWELGDAQVAVACSGGPDSAALAWVAAQRAAERGAPPPALLHVNHHWSSSSVDLQRAAEALAERLDAPLRVAELDPVMPSERRGREGAAREARYRALAQLCETGETVLLAHHADDLLETQLIKLAQGAGLTGLRGPRTRMWLHDVAFARPALSVTRRALRQLVERHALPFAADPSNGDHTLLRNAVRDNVVPALAGHHGVAALRRSAAVVANDAEALSGALDALLDQLSRQIGQDQGALALPADALVRLPESTCSALVRRAWHRVGVPRPASALVARTVALLSSAPGSDATGSRCRVERWWHDLVFARVLDPRAPLELRTRVVSLATGQAACGGFWVRQAAAGAGDWRDDRHDDGHDVCRDERYAFDAAALRGGLRLRLASPDETMVAFGRERAAPAHTLSEAPAQPRWRRAHTWVVADDAGALFVCAGKRSNRAPIGRDTNSVVVFHVDCA